MLTPPKTIYLQNKDLFIEIIISKNQGKLTNTAKLMFEILAKRTIKKMRYYNEDDRMDCYQSGLVDMFANWHNFDQDKTENSFSYFTEVFKRGLAKGFNQLYLKKGDNERQIKVISIESSNDGMGLHSI